MPGHEESDCAYGDPAEPGDIDKAKQLVKQSGDKGEKVTVWTDTDDPHPAIADYYRDLLNEIGFDAETKALDPQVYFELEDRVEADQGADRFHKLVPGLSAPGRLHRDAIEHTGAGRPGDLQPEFRERPGARQEARRARGKRIRWKWPTSGPSSTTTSLTRRHTSSPYGNEESTSFFSERMDAQDCSGIHPVWKNDWLQFCVK